MDLITLVILAVGLAMDAFAVSICKGLAMKKVTLGKATIVGLWFGGFQGLMPLAGYLLGVGFQSAIAAIDHWIAVVLLSFIGGSMIREALNSKEEEADESLAPKAMAVLAVATSIDALAVGVTFAFLQVNILLAVCLIAVITFVLSALGVKIGNVFGSRWESRAELVGGIVLIVLGFKILLEHLGILA